MRTEKAIMSDLKSLCISDGYMHAIAYFCYKYNHIQYNKTIEESAWLTEQNSQPIIRNELSTLIGLAIQEKISLAHPSPAILQRYIDSTYQLLHELHDSFKQSIVSAIKTHPTTHNPFATGESLKEPIFYSSESAYNFQYLSFSQQRYISDDPWLIEKKGFSIKQAIKIITTIDEIQNKKLMTARNDMESLPPEEWTILPGYQLTVTEISNKSNIDQKTTKSVIKQFISKSTENKEFQLTCDFNITKTKPLIEIDKETFLAFQTYTLAEALYESPFFWMLKDKHYQKSLTKHRGDFTEDFCRQRLATVFGTDNVHTNIDLYQSKNKAGEIDVLVTYGDRVIIIQAKSKRLTLEARKGNTNKLKDDFKKAIQASYEQGFRCAQKLMEPNIKLMSPAKTIISQPQKIKNIYLFCIISDHYPSLQFQAKQFLEIEETPKIGKPLIVDIFALDSIAEMLSSPIHFLSYINRRIKYTDQLNSSDELTILSYHLKNNLWFDLEGQVILNDDLATSLDIAMIARRTNNPGNKTPEGILTRFTTTPFGQLIKQIEHIPDPATIDLGYLLLSLGEELIHELNQSITKIIKVTRTDHKSHTVSINLDANTGLIFHTGYDNSYLAQEKLEKHCKRNRQKYNCNDWFGIYLNPTNKQIKFGLKITKTNSCILNLLAEFDQAAR